MTRMLLAYGHLLVTVTVLAAAAFNRGATRAACACVAVVLIVAGCMAGAYLAARGLAGIPPLHF